MGMTLDEIIKYLPAPICGSTVIDSEKQKEYEAHDTAVIIMRKYQKIEELAEYHMLRFLPKERMSSFQKDVLEVLEDGIDN